MYKCVSRGIFYIICNNDKVEKNIKKGPAKYLTAIHPSNTMSSLERMKKILYAITWNDFKQINAAQNAGLNVVF